MIPGKQRVLMLTNPEPGELLGAQNQEKLADFPCSGMKLSHTPEFSVFYRIPLENVPPAPRTERGFGVNLCLPILQLQGRSGRNGNLERSVGSGPERAGKAQRFHLKGKGMRKEKGKKEREREKKGKGKGALVL